MSELKNLKEELEICERLCFHQHKHIQILSKALWVAQEGLAYQVSTRSAEQSRIQKILDLVTAVLNGKPAKIDFGDFSKAIKLFTWGSLQSTAWLEETDVSLKDEPCLKSDVKIMDPFVKCSKYDDENLIVIATNETTTVKGPIDYEIEIKALKAEIKRWKLFYKKLPPHLATITTCDDRVCVTANEVLKFKENIARECGLEVD